METNVKNKFNVTRCLLRAPPKKVSVRLPGPEVKLVKKELVCTQAITQPSFNLYMMSRKRMKATT